MVRREPLGNAHTVTAHVESAGKNVIQVATVNRSTRSHVVLIGTATRLGIASTLRICRFFIRPVESNVCGSGTLYVGGVLGGVS